MTSRYAYVGGEHWLVILQLSDYGRNVKIVKLLGVAVVVANTSTALATEPWIDSDPAERPTRYEIGAIGVRAHAEYRAQATFIDPISLNAETQRRANWIEQRGRLGGTIDYEEKIKLTLSMDLLEGVLFGDNGSFVTEPRSESGMNLTARNPNLAKRCVALLEGDRDPLAASSYGFGLCEADVLRLRHLFAQVSTPIGILRVGRQPVAMGMAVQTASGDGRTNRFGVNHFGNTVDRVLFATKPLEAFKPAAERNLTEHEGFIVATMYDRWVSDSVALYAEDIHQSGVAFRYVDPEVSPLVRGLELQTFYVHRWDQKYESKINTVGARGAVEVGDFHFGFDLAANIGATREVSEAYSVISNDPVVSQDILQFGVRAVARYDRPMWSAYLEADYASGDGDPESGTPLTQFRFAEDANVGLLMFEHVLHFQSARAAGAAVEIIRRLGAETFPAERLNTQGSFTNAFALFPQFDFRPHESILFRGGVLVAWAPAPVIDQVGSLHTRDGNDIADDLVNFVGGKPGTFYGTELDARFQWRFMDHFALDLEAAILFPGDAFEDINGHAVRSVLGQGRTTFFF